jgi:hypothetical protein
MVLAKRCAWVLVTEWGALALALAIIALSAAAGPVTVHALP